MWRGWRRWCRQPLPGGAAEVTLPLPGVVGVPVVDLCVTSGL
eukprot:COSAG01_NODE_56155_length_320_cov_0.868778_1_plen_41_part_01